MKIPIFAIAHVLLAFSAVAVTSSSHSKAPQISVVQYEDIRSLQALGRVIASSDGTFFLYEWGRPYLNWVPDTRWMAPNAARRFQAFLYKVDMRAEKVSSEYLFYPNAGCTYWLGELSPDNRYVVIYELDHDDHRVRAGVWDFESKALKWFKAAPDEGRVQTTVWISNDEFVYPARDGKARLIRASVLTGDEQPCSICSLANVGKLLAERNAAAARVRQIAASIEAKDLREGTELLTGAANGSLAIYVRDNKQELSLYYKQPDKPVRALFENMRK